MNINDIKLNEHNPRDITPEQFEKLKKSLQEFPEMLETRPHLIDKWDIVFSTAYSIYSKISKKLDPELVIKKNGLEI